MHRDSLDLDKQYNEQASMPARDISKCLRVRELASSSSDADTTDAKMCFFASNAILFALGSKTVATSSFDFCTFVLFSLKVEPRFSSSFATYIQGIETISEALLVNITDSLLDPMRVKIESE